MLWTISKCEFVQPFCNINKPASMKKRNFIYLLLLVFISTKSLLYAQPLQLGQAVITKCPKEGSLYYIEVLNTSNVSSAPLLSNNWSVSKYYNASWDITFGQVFGIALDEAAQPNIYITATNLYTGFPFVSGGLGAIYKMDGNTWNPSLLATLPVTAGAGSDGSNSSLGNIAYDKWNNQLFVTNREDGKIYRIDPNTGTILSSYDPINPDDGVAGLCPKGERPWGIGVSKDSKGNIKVFYSIYFGNVGAGGVALNKIYSATLDVAGDFISGSELQEISLEALGSDIEISDIEFSSNGDLLIAERDKYSNNISLHKTRVMKYYGTSQAWSIPQNYFIGNYSLAENAAGGCDFGYSRSEAEGEILSGCDSLVWASGNALTGNTTDYVYGLAGIPITGNSNNPLDPNYAGATSIYADYDDTIFSPTSSKGLFGDVDIYREACPDYESLCELIGADFFDPDTTDDNCCFQINAFNDYDANYFTGLQIIAGTDLNLSYVEGSGIGHFDATSATVLPPDGLEYIPVGSFDNFLTVCLNNINTDEQYVILNWLGPVGPDGTSIAVCSDTLFFSCDPVTYEPTCTTVAYDTIYCSGDSVIYQFQIKNANANVFNVSAFNLLFDDLTDIQIPTKYFVLATPLLPGETSQTFSFDLTGYGVDAGRELCITIVAHNDIMDSFHIPTICCTDTLALNCFLIPDCDCVDKHCDLNNLLIPTGFSPNGDGINDLYEITGFADVCELNMTVFNRWGNIVFQQQNYTNNWDGKSNNGSDLAQGTYFMVLKTADGISTKSTYIDLRRQ